MREITLPNYKLSNKDFIENFMIQLKLIKNSCDLYDKGDEFEAIHLASNLRVLLHDKNRNVSLFEHLEIKHKVKYLSTTLDFQPANLMSHFGLGYIRTTNIQSEYKPNLDLDYSRSKLLNFDEWWNEIILSDTNEFVSRKDVILGIADKEGGAHIDSEIDDVQRKFSKENGLGWESNGVPILTNTYYVSLRVIAQEILESLKLFEEAKFIDHYLSNLYIPFRRKKPNGQVYFVWINQKLKKESDKINQDLTCIENIEMKHYIEKYKIKSDKTFILINKIV